MVPQTRSKRSASQISTDRQDYTAAIPAEIFHLIVSFIPDLEVARLRQVSKTWRDRLDARAWLFRSLVCRSEEKSALIRDYVRDHLKEYANHLKYLDLDFTWNRKLENDRWDVDDAFLYVNDDCKHLQTMILRALGIEQGMMEAIVPKLAEKKALRTLKLTNLWWSQFHRLLPRLPYCHSLTTLEISMRSTNLFEPQSANYWHFWNNLVQKEYAVTEERPIPSLKEPLSSLRTLSIDLTLPPTSGPGVTTGRPHNLEQMYIPFVALLASATNLEELTITNTKSTSTEFEPGNWHFSFEANWMPYQAVFENIMKTHKSLKTVTIENVILSEEASAALKGVHLVNRGTEAADEATGVRPA